MNLEKQLRAALAPCEPGPESLAIVMSALSMPGRPTSRSKRRGRGPIILVGTILVVAAAAAILGWSLSSKPVPQPAAIAALLPPAPAAAEVTAESAPPPVVAPQPAVPPAPATPAAKPFTVRVSLEYRSANETARTALRSLHSAFVERLGLIPGLNLVESGPTAAGADAPEYLITLFWGGDVDPQSGSFMVMLDAQKTLASGVPTRLGFTATVSILPNCVGRAAADMSMPMPLELLCNDTVSVAAYLVGLLRLQQFPPDASLLRQMQAQLRNRRLEPGKRLRILGDLLGLRSKAAGAQFDAAFVAGAIDLTASATDPAVRAQVWRTVRGIGSAELIPALIAASRQDSDGAVRLEAVSTLAVDFAGNEHARAALETLARRDARPLVRAVAQRGLAGDAVWRQFVSDSLKDEGRTDVERVEALSYDLFEGRLPNFVSNNSGRIPALLDEEGIRALAQVLPRLRPSAQMTGAMLEQLAADASVIDHPAVTEMLLDSLRNSSNGGPVTAAMAVRPLLGHGDEARISAALRESTDPKVRTQLDLARTGDPDPRRREMAADILKPVPTPPTP